MVSNICIYIYVPNCWIRYASLRFFLFGFSLLIECGFGDSFGWTATAAACCTETTCCTDTGSLDATVTASVALFVKLGLILSWTTAVFEVGELSFLAAFPVNAIFQNQRWFIVMNIPNFHNIPFLPFSFLLALRPSDSSRCFLISKSSLGWLFSKWFNVSVVPFAGGAGFAAAVNLFTRIPVPGDFDALVLRIGGVVLPVDNWRCDLKCRSSNR